MEIRYVGPFDLVEIADSGDEVAQGATVTVDADLAAQLLEQPDNWQPVKSRKPTGDAAGITTASTEEQ